MRKALLALFVVATIVAGAPRLFETLRTAREMARLETIEQRRTLLFGSWYAAVEALKRSTPESASIDFVMLRPEGRDVAVLGAAELQPRDVRLFDGWDAWRRRERAILLHDDRAANAVPGPPPPVAPIVVLVDPA
ncbi:MAG TPA: hypothetical protein VFO89_04955, partial [Thermoanaerobaculia bacterium]|nr:hypothetical protein [Thermoanaerobaculia bacterium]